ncbi:glycosyl transferase group 1 : Glycosyltransferase OS=Singulisphaera acidiphila (strain ATCC BAA-1392 / DSM 18658 / VKM B-2454 / MOB10) GN=Sinac_5387 PE=4 SV=1: Glyco_trans_4_4: Glycos_transf_1 [Gemmataceae bacterium]|nr:glycosyl transferase group 1 : Glycosyltransferase OS=Singulisphaera acidiphila (strain ATCC BAA-1392 / DSM 18658 / VKM B-2454 / MOB10) GN=Sinac_5387 PE=4 SV=1: Glyco_trans_4_4: Glycos_transf_1 [Gemmataceae bacterium]VTT96335.1 glycosyl transferase group 1 : Glycosyltransferase OS=Singulisphaera acidiphila (strain ATCC BAA-1392 / DSM 18658 / VKM B-2454 / MOB10) GN=Sinac_5387 PE=4 SV=1: Glyco_trans_4_4: Glycos_transf_1 [Gemmataceae bacterium]
MHVAQFVHRYPPALGGAEAYTARLSEYLAARGDTVTVWTTTAIELTDFWRPKRAAVSSPSPLAGEGNRASRPGEGEGHTTGIASPFTRRSKTRGTLSRSGERATNQNHGHNSNGADAAPLAPNIRRYSPLHFPARRYVLKALSLLPVRSWQCLTSPCNPVCPAMWRDVGRYDGPLDAVHATAFPYSFPIVCGLRLAKRRGVPFFVTPFLHIGDPTDPADHTRRQYTRPHLRWLLKQADGVFVQTNAERDVALSLGVREEHVHLQGLGVDVAECTGGDRRRAHSSWGVTPSEVVIGHLANNSEEKGTCDLLRAAERAWAAGHRFRVVLAGPEMPNFRTFWRNFAGKHHVTRLGVLTDAQKRDFFAGIDAFALPSRTDSFGLVLLEAWANGKPNVVYRAGGPGELVRHELDGLQAKCGDVSELAHHLGRLAEDASLRRELGEAGRQRLPHDFTWDRSLSLVRDTLSDAAERPVTPTSARRVAATPR